MDAIFTGDEKEFVEIEDGLSVFVDFGAHIIRGLRGARTRRKQRSPTGLKKTTAVHEIHDITFARVLEAQM